MSIIENTQIKRSPQFKNVIEASPSWFVSWGISTLFVIFLLVLVILHFIPDGDGGTQLQNFIEFIKL